MTKQSDSTRVVQVSLLFFQEVQKKEEYVLYPGNSVVQLFPLYIHMWPHMYVCGCELFFVKVVKMVKYLATTWVTSTRYLVPFSATACGKLVFSFNSNLLNLNGV